MHRFHHYTDYPIDFKVEDEELPPMDFELAESSRSSELHFVHPLTNGGK